MHYTTMDHLVERNDRFKAFDEKEQARKETQVSDEEEAVLTEDEKVPKEEKEETPSTTTLIKRDIACTKENHLDSLNSLTSVLAVTTTFTTPEQRSTMTTTVATGPAKQVAAFRAPSSSPPRSTARNATTATLDDVQRLERALEQALETNTKLQEDLEAAHAKRNKLTNNLKSKKTLLTRALSAQGQLQANLAESRAETERLLAENAKLKVGLQTVSANKQDLVLQLQSQRTDHVDLKAAHGALQRQCDTMQRKHATEQALLDQYRQLSYHTGYYKWGKPIRALESELAAAAAAAAQANGSNHSTSKDD